MKWGREYGDERKPLTDSFSEFVDWVWLYFFIMDDDVFRGKNKGSLTDQVVLSSWLRVNR